MTITITTLTNTEAVTKAYVTGWAHRRHWKPAYKTARVEADRATQPLAALCLGVTEAQVAGVLATATHPPRAIAKRNVWIDAVTQQLLMLS